LTKAAGRLEARDVADAEPSVDVDIRMICTVTPFGLSVKKKLFADIHPL